MFHHHYADYYDLFNASKPYKRDINMIYKWAKQPKNWLDLGCGTANYWAYIPETTRVRGIEKSKDMIDSSAHHNQIKQSDIMTRNYSKMARYECVTALFDVVNYTSNLKWINRLPVKKGHYFIFDVWDKDRVSIDGFKKTYKKVQGAERHIIPHKVTDKYVFLSIVVLDGTYSSQEMHKMHLWSHFDIARATTKEYEIIECKETKKWQTWYVLQKR